MPAKKSRQSTKSDMDSLTDRQHRIIDVIHDAIVLRGYPPSIREIGQAAGLTSTSSVAYQLKELERKGFLRRDPNKPRAVGLKIADPTKPAGPSSLHHAMKNPPHLHRMKARTAILSPTILPPSLFRRLVGLLQVHRYWRNKKLPTSFPSPENLLAKETYTSCQWSVNP